jgi:lincosamide nucleotidyltransferase A/C/D/E
VEAQDVVELYTVLLDAGVQIWVDGGWGIDALLARQTRPHKDLDAVVSFDDLHAMAAVFDERGFTLKELWENNLWVPYREGVPIIGRGSDVATAFVLHDAEGRELDIKPVHFDEDGRGRAAWDTDFIFTAETFEGRGVIAGVPVWCLSAATQMQTHTGYELKDKDVQDLRSLSETFGIDYPDEHAHLRSTPREMTS